MIQDEPMKVFAKFQLERVIHMTLEESCNLSLKDKPSSIPLEKYVCYFIFLLTATFCNVLVVCPRKMSQ